MSHPADPAHALNRRLMLRGGAVAAGATALAALTRPTSAAAADGDPVNLGTANTAASATAITIAAGDAPALKLTNPAGPALTLEPVSDSWAGELELGQIANSSAGPLVGVDFGSGAETLFLATTRDIDSVPVTFSLPPTRIVDTRWANVPITIIQTSDGALDSKQRLRADAWIDVAIAPAGEGFEYSSVFINVSAVKPTKNGYLVAYPPGDRPVASTVNYEADQTTSNAAFVSVSQVADSYAVRVYASSTTHVMIDVTGVIVSTDQSVTPVAAASVRNRLHRSQHKTMEARITKAMKSTQPR